LKSVLLIAIVAVAMIGMMVPSVFATHDNDVDYSNDPEYDGKKPFTFYQIFVSEDQWYQNECEEAKNSMLRSKSIQILKMYDYLPITSKIECATVIGDLEYDKDSIHESSTYGLPLEKIIDNAKLLHYDLLIIIFDQNLSDDYIKKSYAIWDKGAWGHIVYDMKTIVSSTWVKNTEDSTSILILAHEIAHYEIAKRYGNSIGGDAVHKVEDALRDCDEYLFYNNYQNGFGLLESCPELWTTVKTHYGYELPVMSPEYVIEIAESMVAPKYTPSVQKEIVKVIWFDQPTNYRIGQQTLIEGKLVDSKNYPISGKIISIKDYNFGELVRTVTDKQGMFRYTWTPTSENNAISANFKGSDTMITTGSMLTTNLIIEKPLIIPKVEERAEPIYDNPKNISHANAVYSEMALDYDPYPSWVSMIMYWYVMEDISPDEFLAIINYLNAKHIICVGICSK